MQTLVARSLNVAIAVFEMSRDAHLCNVRIKVSRLVDSTGVIIERLDEHIQTRDIEKNFRIKKTKHTYCGAMYTKLKTTRQLRYTMQSYVGRECGVEVYETMGTVWVEEGNGWNVMRVIGDGKV